MSTFSTARNIVTPDMTLHLLRFQVIGVATFPGNFRLIRRGGFRALNEQVNVLDELRDVLQGLPECFVDLLFVQFVILVNDPVAKTGSRSDFLGKLDRQHL